MSDVMTAIKLLRELGLTTESNAPNKNLVLETISLMHMRADPNALTKKCLEYFQQADHNRRQCELATDAAQNIEALMQSLLSGPGKLYRFQSLRHGESAPIAVCHLGREVCEFPIHPDLDLTEIEELQPWEYVRVHKDLVVGVWSGDPSLWRAAQGEVVEFKEYADSEHRMAHVTRHGGTGDMVELAGRLRSEELTPGARLILQRDQPHWAIGSLTRQSARSRFEVPSDQVASTTFEDLAGLEWLTERLVMEVMKRIIFADNIQKVYDLDPLRGMLLLSRKPGMGKTSFVRAFANFLTQVGKERGFDVVLYHVKPNETKSMWHGEDARIIREDLFGAIRARRDLPRKRQLFQLLVLDEIDSLGRRPGAGDSVSSSAQSDALESVLVELDGMTQSPQSEDQPAHLMVIGMSNRPDRIDEAIKRPGRLGDLVLEMDDLSCEAALGICAVYGRHSMTPWQLNGKATIGPTADELAVKILRPAVSGVYGLVILHYYNDNQRRFDVTAGQVMSGAHYREAMNRAKNKAAERKLLAAGNPAVTYDDVVGGLLEMAMSLAAQMASDPQMLVRQLDIQGPVVRVEAVAQAELDTHSFLRVPASHA